MEAAAQMLKNLAGIERGSQVAGTERPWGEQGTMKEGWLKVYEGRDRVLWVTLESLDFIFGAGYIPMGVLEESV